MKKIIKKINIMETKKEIKNIIAEHREELKKGTMGYHSCGRNIYLTGYDYVRVYIWGYAIEISLHLDNSELCVFYKDGSINDLDGVWRKFRNAFKKSIAEEEEFGRDAKFLAKLKELYSLL